MLLVPRTAARPNASKRDAGSGLQLIGFPVEVYTRQLSRGTGSAVLAVHGTRAEDDDGIPPKIARRYARPHSRDRDTVTATAEFD